MRAKLGCRWDWPRVNPYGLVVNPRSWDVEDMKRRINGEKSIHFNMFRQHFGFRILVGRPYINTAQDKRHTYGELGL